MGVIRGSTIPLDITDYDSVAETATPLNWTNLERYYRLDTYKDDIIDDLTTASVDVGSGAKIYNSKLMKHKRLLSHLLLRYLVVVIGPTLAIGSMVIFGM